MSASDWNNDQWSMFWATAKELGYKPDDIHRLFGVKSMKEWTGGTFAEAIAALKLGKDGDGTPTPAEQVATAQFPDAVAPEPQTTTDEADTPEGVAFDFGGMMEWFAYMDEKDKGSRERLAGLPEAPFSVNFFIATPTAHNAQVTIRDVDDRLGMLRVNRIIWGLGKMGCYPVNRNGNILAKPAMAVAAAAERRQPSAPQGPAAPPTPGVPAQTEQLAPQPMGEQVFNIHSFKVTAPSGKAVVEFWRTGRKYPEIKWYLGCEKLLEISPTLAAAGWTKEHFDVIGSEHTVRLNVFWEQSPKDDRYKDITRVELAQ